MEMPKLRLPAALALILALLALASAPASAKSNRKVSYSYEQIWPTAVRFLRVDEGLKILEKDADAGYVLFELSDEGKRFQGSMELVRGQDESTGETVDIIVQISDRPSYMEVSILDRMLKKIRSELGEPKEAPKQAPKKAPKTPPAEKGEGQADDAPAPDPAQER